eukprot:g27087.t1
MHRSETLEANIVVFICRVFLYLGSMCKILYTQIRSFVADCKSGAIDRTYYIPIPQYLFSLQSGGNFMLFWLLVGMCTTEPLWRCGAFSTTEDHIIFSTHCQSVLDDGTKRVYSMFSCLAILLYWTLLLDFSIFSMHISAYVLVFGRVLSEVALFIMALVFLVISYSTAIMALEHELLDFAETCLQHWGYWEDFGTWLLSLTQMSLAMFPQVYYQEFEKEANLLVVVIAFVLIVSVILVNLLVAQLNQAYQHVYTDMQGARWERMCLALHRQAMRD